MQVIEGEEVEVEVEMKVEVEVEVEFRVNHVNAFVACCYARAGDDLQSRNETNNLLRMRGGAAHAAGGCRGGDEGGRRRGGDGGVNVEGERRFSGASVDICFGGEGEEVCTGAEARL